MNATLDRDPLTERIIGLAIEVHRSLGPGLLESAYEACLCYELAKAKLAFTRQTPVPLNYKGEEVDCAFRADVIVADAVLPEIKSVETLRPIHQAQLLTYMRLTNIPTGLLLNFNSQRLVDGMKRMIL